MEQPIPDWLDNDFLAQCLQTENDNKNIVVTNFTASLAAPAGNNYGGCVVRARVEYKDSKDDQELQTISLIVKSEVTEGPVLLDGVKYKEPTFYKKFLPRAEQFSNIEFAPKSLFSPKELVTVMEDLREKGFLMADRVKQLDFDHCQLYMKAVASLHAVSFAVQKEDPELIKTLGTKWSSGKEITGLLKNMLKNGAKCFAEATERIDRFKGYSTLIRDISPNLFDLVEEVQQSQDGLKTLTQGGPWTTDMMFRYDHNGVVQEIKLLDYQLLTYASPVNDLVQFIWSSANHDVRRNRLDDLYHIYCDSLNQKLEELKCTERMDFLNLMNGINRLRPLVLQIAVSTLPWMYDLTPIDIGAFQDENAAENPYDKYFNENFCNNHLPKLLEQLEIAGVFDHLENYSKTK